jgi:hypothetical protein
MKILPAVLQFHVYGRTDRMNLTGMTGYVWLILSLTLHINTVKL